MIRRDKQQGFTLIELLFALVFVSFILIFAVVSVVQVMSSYNKGLAVKEMNQVGRATIADISQYVKSIDPAIVNIANEASGRACFGGVSYVWNLQGGSSNAYDDVSADPIVLARVNDPAGAICASTTSSIPINDSTDLLTSRTWVQQVDFTQSGSLLDIDVIFSVAGEDVVAGACAAGNEGQYCAISNFSTTVVMNGGQ